VIVPTCWVFGPLADRPVPLSPAPPQPSPLTPPRDKSALRRPTGNREKSVKHRHPAGETSSGDIDVSKAAPRGDV